MDPEIPRVRLRPPSESPPPRIRLRRTLTQDDISDVEISTPRRRIRGPGLRRKPTGRTSVANFKPNTTQNQHHTANTPSTSLIVTFPTFNPRLSPFHDRQEMTPTDDDQFPSSTMDLEEELIKGPNDTYEYFVEAVMAQVCSIYQLTDRLFLVNGWNAISRTPTVCLATLYR